MFNDRRRDPHHVLSSTVVRFSFVFVFVLFVFLVGWLVCLVGFSILLLDFSTQKKNSNRGITKINRQIEGEGQNNFQWVFCLFVFVLFFLLCVLSALM